MIDIMTSALFSPLDSFLYYWFVIVGCLCLGGGGAMLWRRARVLLLGVRVSGEISKWEKRADAESQNTYFYFPHVRYRDASGRTHEMRIDRGFNREQWPIGTEHGIVFDRCDPARAYSARPTHALAGALALMILGAVALLIVLPPIRLGG